MSGHGLKQPIPGATMLEDLKVLLTAVIATMHGSILLEAAKYSTIKLMMNGFSVIILEPTSITIQNGHGEITIMNGIYGMTIMICGLFLNMELFNLLFEIMLAIISLS